MNWAWLARITPFAEPAPVERADEAAQAKAEATHRHEAAREVVAVRQHVINTNHIARDIGIAYALTRKGK